MTHPPTERMIPTQPPGDPYIIGLWWCETENFAAKACTAPTKHLWRIKWVSQRGGSFENY